MIIYYQGEEQFCHRVEYSHDTDILKSTAQVKKFMTTFKNGFRTRKCMSLPKLVQPADNYNNYYVNPEMRYKKKTIDPKTEKKNLVSRDYLYNHLRDDGFNNWKHPFEKDPPNSSKAVPQISDGQLQKLVKFKQYIQQNRKGRVPAVVNQALRKEGL